jgi:hypothetical protein
MQQKFLITCSYAWTVEEKKNKSSEDAIKKIVAATNKRFSGKKHSASLSYKIEFKRLRASAGSFLANNFLKRIKEANAIIIDITHNNENVMAELGIAFTIQQEIKPSLSVYLIAEGKVKAPSNFQGYFVSEYALEKGKIVFKDQNSLMMSIASDVRDFYNSIEVGSLNDEVNEKFIIE